MEKKEIRLWGIHGGKTGDADSWFLKGNCVALGWPHMQDLNTIPPDREAFKKAVASVYSDKSAMSVANNAGQLFRFVKEMQIGDIVVYPSRADKLIHFGKVLGNYEYRQKKNPDYPHVRPVRWIGHVARTAFTQGALYEVGSAMSFFSVKDYADEFIGIMEGKQPVVPVTKDDSVGAVASDIVAGTGDFILKTLSQELKGLPLEEFIRHVLQAMGYRARLTDRNEPSVDIIAHKDALGLEPPIIKVQVKSSDEKASDKDVSALVGKLVQNEYGMVIALAGFTPPAKVYASNKTNLRLIDGDQLVELIYEYYDGFDARYKGLLPLKRVYIPAPLEQ